MAPRFAPNNVASTFPVSAEITSDRRTKTPLADHRIGCGSLWPHRHVRYPPLFVVLITEDE